MHGALNLINNNNEIRLKYDNHTTFYIINIADFEGF